MRLQRDERQTCEEGIGNGAECPFSAQQSLAPLSAPEDALPAVREDRSMEIHFL